MQLTDLPNIDIKMAEMLDKMGIKNAEELKILGAEKAFLLLIEVYPKAKLEHLFRLEAAIEEIPLEKLSTQKKEELQIFYEICGRE